MPVFVIESSWNMFSKNPLLNLLQYLWHYSVGAHRRVVWFVVLSALGNVVWLLSPIVIGKIFDVIQFEKSGSQQVTLVAWGALALVVINAVGWFFHGVSRVIETKNAFLARKNYRQTLFAKTMELPTSWHKDHHSGDTIDKINKASERLFDFSSELFIMIQNSIGLVMSIVVLSLYDVRPLVIVLLAAMASIIMVIKFDTRLIKQYRTINKGENFIAAGIYDYISNYVTIISLRLKGQAVKEMETRSMKPFVVFGENSKINEWKWFSANTLISIMTSGALLWNAYNSYRDQGVIVIGTLFILYQYLTRVGDSFYTFTWKYGEVVKQNAAMVAAEDILREHAKLCSEKPAGLPRDWKVIQLKKLNFTYRGEDGDQQERQAVIDASLSIERNKKIALIGVSGSGKSTILSLLRGLHRADSVSVYCDGKKLEKGLAHIHEQCTLIPQESEIFNNTIEYNITLGVHLDHKEVERVIELANLGGLIGRLEKGLKTSVLERGVSLSGGEKQRLALARGLLAAANSQFLLLDEPTSSVDVENEVQIYQNIFNAFDDKVVISAVHSLHLLQHFDYVYMFKDSQIIGEGTFNMLLNDENFKVLWRNYSVECQQKKLQV